MLKICKPMAEMHKDSIYYDRICCNWVCKCGYRFGQHWIEGPEKTKFRCHTLRNSLFRFKHNNNCTLECQMAYKLYEISMPQSLSKR